ncbi:rho GTPase-activating protein gacF-like [Penaeus monodon]|uniref:rho GTPase-activating protein gacF-like n=1 Tax=Penaeus monodon TaxID=6687 RepID=UPI0018A751B2|nr:rho GTPase-activating protein gacF-like [Penaeus monodon]
MTLPSALPLPDTSNRAEASPLLPSATRMADCKAIPSRTLSKLPLQTATASVSLDSSRTATSSKGMLTPTPTSSRLLHSSRVPSTRMPSSRTAEVHSSKTQMLSLETASSQVPISLILTTDSRPASSTRIPTTDSSLPSNNQDSNNRFQSSFNNQNSNNRFPSSFNNQDSNNRFQSTFNNQDSSNRFSQNSQASSFLRSGSSIDSSVNSVSGVFEPLNLPSGASFLLGSISSSFNCLDRPYGYYADQDNSCRVFHVCNPALFSNGAVETYQYSFMCGEGTVFDQKELACVTESSAIPCQESSNYFYTNEQFGRPKTRHFKRNQREFSGVMDYFVDDLQCDRNSPNAQTSYIFST